MSAAPLDTQGRPDRPPQAVQEAGAAAAAPAPPEEQVPHEPAEVDLVHAVAERDEYLEALQRLQAEYDNYRRRMQRELQEALSGAGLQRLEPAGEVFDPAEQHAVAHDPADDADEPAQPTVVEVLRPGYRWKDRLVRPALVHVRG